MSLLVFLDIVENILSGLCCEEIRSNHLLSTSSFFRSRTRIFSKWWWGDLAIFLLRLFWLHLLFCYISSSNKHCHHQGCHLLSCFRKIDRYVSYSWLSSWWKGRVPETQNNEDILFQQFSWQRLHQTYLEWVLNTDYLWVAIQVYLEEYLNISQYPFVLLRLLDFHRSLWRNCRRVWGCSIFCHCIRDSWTFFGIDVRRFIMVL